MIHVNIPDKERYLSFYLAMEEYIADNFNADEYFFMWQVKPTVIIGRNQLMENEVNLTYIKENGIQIFRRKSGGGCVYSDYSNIMFSYIVKNADVSGTFEKYLKKITQSLHRLGLNAVFSSRNDITIDDKKISGNAFYRKKEKSIVHGTMLFNTDLERLVFSITPNNEKLISKGIESVSKRVANLSDYIDMDIEEFKAFMRKDLCDEELILTEEDEEKIKTIELEYLTEEFIHGNNPAYTLIKKSYGKAGDLEIHIKLKNNMIKDIKLVGDYFLLGDVNEGLINKLINLPYKLDIVKDQLADVKVDQVIHQLTNEEFLKILFKDEI